MGGKLSQYFCDQRCSYSGDIFKVNLGELQMQPQGF